MKRTSKKILAMGLMAGWLACWGCKAPEREYASLPVEEFERYLTDTAVVRLDVRTADEYAEGHIVGTMNLDVLRPDFESRALAELPREKTVAVYCRSGKRSKKAAELLVKNRFKVIELDGGFEAWKSSGRAVTK